MTLAVVETLYETNASNVPAMLRQSADSVESETDKDDRTRAMIAVQVSHGGLISVYGWGEAERLRCIGALQAAIVKLADGVKEHCV